MSQQGTKEFSFTGTQAATSLLKQGGKVEGETKYKGFVCYICCCLFRLCGREWKKAAGEIAKKRAGAITGH
eukprot:4866634-Heterocapsa_arctica.AAC.1